MEPLKADDPEGIGGYRLLGRLGEGGMGRVYLARSDRGRMVAVKTVRSELAQQDDFRRRFAREVAAARSVGSPDGGTEWTAPVFGADPGAAMPWVATGYVAGPSLSAIVREQYGPLPPASVLGLAAGLVQALRAVHGAGLVHRDLKPSNVLVTIDGPRIIDFGIARALDAASGTGLTRTGGLVGSPGFMSPEQVRGERITGASDVFCLGTVLAYAATGREPFGSTESGLHALLFRIAEEEPDLGTLDGELRALVRDCLAKSPEDRPSLDELEARTRGALDSRAWLPGEVLAELGRHAVQLLDSEDPESPVLPSPAAATAGVGGEFGPAPSPGSFGPPAYGPPTGPPAPAASPYAPPGGPYAAAEAQPTGTPPPSAKVPVARRARWLPKLLRAGLMTFLVLMIAELTVNVVAGAKLDRTARDHGGNAPISEFSYRFGGVERASLVLYMVSAVVFVACAVLWLVWFRRMRLNAEAFAPGRVRHSVAMAVAGWLIPLLSFVVPKQILNDVWTASYTDGDGRRKPPRVLHTVWWLLWTLFWPLYSFADLWTGSGSVAEALRMLILHTGSVVLGLAATVPAIALVRRLTLHQQRRLG